MKKNHSIVSVGNTRLLPHAKMLLVPMNFFLWQVDYTWRKTFWLSKCDFCRLFHAERSWHAFSAVIVVCGRHDLLDLSFNARAFLSPLLKCNASQSFRLNKGFRLFNFLLSASWTRTIISDFLLVRECDGSCLAFAFLITRFRFLVTVYSKGKKMDIHISVSITIRNMLMSCRQVALSKLTENCGHR